MLTTSNSVQLDTQIGQFLALLLRFSFMPPISAYYPFFYDALGIIVVGQQVLMLFLHWRCGIFGFSPSFPHFYPFYVLCAHFHHIIFVLG